MVTPRLRRHVTPARGGALGDVMRSVRKGRRRAPRTQRRPAVSTGRPLPEDIAAAHADNALNAENRALLGDDPQQRVPEPRPNEEGSIEDPLHDWPDDT